MLYCCAFWSMHLNVPLQLKIGALKVNDNIYHIGAPAIFYYFSKCVFSAIYVTMCPPSYHHNGFMATPELGHRMYGSCFSAYKWLFQKVRLYGTITVKLSKLSLFLYIIPSCLYLLLRVAASGTQFCIHPSFESPVLLLYSEHFSLYMYTREFS